MHVFYRGKKNIMTHFFSVLVQVCFLLYALVTESAVSPFKAVKLYTEEHGEAFADSGLAAIFPSLNLEKPEIPFASRKRRMINDSPETPSGFAHFPFSSEDSSPKSANFSHYSQPNEVQEADDDYFFFDVEKNYTRFELVESTLLPGRAPKGIDLSEASVPLPIKIEDFVVDGSEIIPKEEAAVRISSPVQHVRKRPRRDSKTTTPTTTIFDRICTMKDNIITLSLGNRLEPSTDIQPKTAQELAEISSAARQPTTSNISDTIYGMIKPFFPSLFDLEAQGFYSQDTDNANAEEDGKEEHWSLLPDFDLEAGNENGNEYSGFF